MISFPSLEQVCCSMSSSNCCFLACIQISQEASKVILYSHLFKNFPQFVVIHTVKGFSIVNEGEVDVFLEFPCFFYDPADIGNLISGSSASSKSSLYVWKFSVHVQLKPSMKDFEHYLASTWDECNCGVDLTFFGIALLWDWNENWPFPVLWPLLNFTDLLAYWVQHFNSIILKIFFLNFIYLFFLVVFVIHWHESAMDIHVFPIPIPPPPHLPLHPIPLGLPSAPGPSTCLMHPTWAGGPFHPR